jgi:hypothetical protein
MNATILVLLMLAAGVVLVAVVAGMAAALRTYSDDHGWWCGGDCDCRLAISSAQREPETYAERVCREYDEWRWREEQSADTRRLQWNHFSCRWDECPFHSGPRSELDAQEG